VWRVRPGGRIAAVCLVGLWASISGLITAGGGVTVGVIVMLWAATLIVGLGVWRWAFVPKVELTRENLLVQNPFGHVAVIPYTKISGAQVGYSGIMVQMRDGSRVLAWAVQKSNMARWAKKRSRADDVADAIMLKAGQVGV
jgi:hypothetical protein